MLEFCLTTKLLIQNEEKIVITELGNKILLEFKGNYDLNEFQKEIIAKECILKGEYLEKIFPMFKFFKRNYSRKTLYCSKILIGQVGDLEMLPLLYQSDILRKEDKIVFLNPKYVNLISVYQSRDPKKIKLTREKLNQIQKTKDEIGLNKDSKIYQKLTKGEITLRLRADLEKMYLIGLAVTKYILQMFYTFQLFVQMLTIVLLFQ